MTALEAQAWDARYREQCDRIANCQRCADADIGREVCVALYVAFLVFVCSAPYWWGKW